MSRRRGPKPASSRSRPEADENEGAPSSGETATDLDAKSSGSRRRRRDRSRPTPDDILEADSLEDGHERNIDPVAAGAAIYADHGLDLTKINEDAVKVLRRLNRHGFQSYLVGGCVRDLLVGQEPKDFDIATSATPRQIRKLFRNSRVIGRRFRLVHIHFGDHIIEVSTFRSNAPRTEDDDDPLIRRDNVFGTADQDALRRDFTINALFFDIENDQVIDFVGGMKDVKRRLIEIIGDPVQRLREDPVRMLRAAKFAGRLDFDLAADLFDAIGEVRHDLDKCPAPRLFEELQRLLSRGSALGAFEVLYDTGLLEVYLPEVAAYLDEDRQVEGLNLGGEQRLWNTLRALDRHELASDIGSSAVVKLGALLCHLFDQVLHHQGPPPGGISAADFDIGVVTERILNPLAARLQMPRRDIYRLKQVVIALRRLLARKASRRKPSPNQFVRKEYFLDSLLIFDLYSQGLGQFHGEVHRWKERYEEITGRRYPGST
ncbi:MAG: polynucleotide adenylyltransferase PcnB [Planctomycetes bacterium]|nr:polynucleotide adenylyltransferase PcnB [Planctomycetota bacterium]